MKTVEIVANKLVEAWNENMSANSAQKVRLASAKINEVSNFANELGIWEDVYKLANDIYHGRV